MAEKYKNTCKVDLVMQPLIKKINDESANYTISYRKVYAMLRKTDPNINWANLKKDMFLNMEVLGIVEKGR